jgi:hypothetical protein
MLRAIEALSARDLLFNVVARLVGFGAGDQINLLDLTAAVKLDVPHGTHVVLVGEVEWVGSLRRRIEIRFEIRVVRNCLSNG